ncbi:hypothetical protein [Kineosporia sp. A_224]|uniref:hypothetical protein n=1 Tax=Kineosporia sp. A_224 TaxID=1962180 RepID=UPI00117A23A8|nr:hypothetical protein [Kineosporia sp. A_224]
MLRRALTRVTGPGIAATVLAAAVVLAGPAGAGRADDAPLVVTVPRLPAGGVEIDLVAASAQMAVLRRWDVSRWELVGGSGGQLGPVLQGEAADVYPAPTMVGTRFHRVVGDDLVVTDLAGGQTVRHPLEQRRFLGATEAGWLTWSQDDGGVLLHDASGGTRTVLAAPVFAPDVHVGGRWLLATRASGSGTPSDPLVVDLLLVDVVRGTSETLASGDDLGAAAGVSADVVTWVSGSVVDWWGNQTGTPVVNVRRTAGGPVETFPMPTALRDLVAFDGGVAYVVGPDQRLVVRPSSGRPVDTGLSGVSGLTGAGPGLRAVVSGATSKAGVWAVTATGGAARVARVAPTTKGWGAVDLNAGDLFAAAADPATGTQSYRMHLGGTPGAVVVGRAQRVRAAAGVAGRSGGRSLVARPTSYWRSGYSVFADRGQAGDVVAVPGDYPGASLSGPYAWSAAGVTRADGQRIGGSRAWPDEQVGPLVGHLALNSTWRQPGEVRVRDLRTPDAPPQRVWLDCPVTHPYCATGVVLTGDHLVWARGDDLVVRDMRTRTRRVLPGVRASGLLGDAGTVVWTQDGDDPQSLTYYALDLTDPAAAPVRLASTRRSIFGSSAAALEDGVLAWIDGAGDLRVLRLPFTPRGPRLLGALGDTFSPDGDGQDDAWRPELDLTRPVARVRVSVRRGPDLVRVLEGTAPDGSVRDVRWDGLDARGMPAADGEYTWTLDDLGDGTGAARPVPDVDGAGPAAGTVTLARSVLPTTVRVPVTSAAVSTSAGIPVRWGPASPSAQDGIVRYDVRARTVRGLGTPPAEFGPPTVWLSGTTDRSAVYGAAPGDVVQFSARGIGADGVAGTWSPWTGSGASLDDRALSGAYDAWTRVASDDAYLGTLTVTRKAGATLTTQATTSRVTVVGERCPACGRLTVQVDGVTVATVDTYAPKVVPRAMLLDRRVANWPHTVSLVAAPAAGRPEVRVDAVGFVTR